MLCACGCGQETSIAKRSRPYLGHIKGHPVPYATGHNSYKKPVTSNSYKAIHQYLKRNLTRSGICDECGESPGRTDWALIHGREYSRNREDYRELCAPCHGRYDASLQPVGENRWNAVLTDEIVRDCRRRCNAGETRRALALEYGVSEWAVYSAVNGKTWKHIDEEVCRRAS